MSQPHRCDAHCRAQTQQILARQAEVRRRAAAACAGLTDPVQVARTWQRVEQELGTYGERLADVETSAMVVAGSVGSTP